MLDHAYQLRYTHGPSRFAGTEDAALRMTMPCLRRATLAVMLTLCLAHASMAKTMPVPPSPFWPVGAEVVDGVPVADAERVLTQALEAIAQRHLDPVIVSDLALEGLRGLGSLDPAITVRRDGNRVLLVHHTRILRTFTAPADMDSLTWGRLMVAGILAARRASEILPHADMEALYQVVLDSTLARLDPFSRYAGRREARRNQSARSGFGGVGMSYELSQGAIVVTDVVDGSPAQAQGLALGDLVIKINGDPVARMTADDIAGALRGPIDSTLSLTVLSSPRSTPRTLTMRRDLVIPQTTYLDVRDGVATLRITAFNQRTATAVANAMRTAMDQGPLRGFILDLRGNPGGLLDQTIAVADQFLDAGAIVTTRGRHPQSFQSYTASAGDLGDRLPMVVLMDGKAASSAEILAAALQDDGRAVIVGSNTYGKGTVQTIINLPNGGEITLTWSRFHTPSGYALDGLGVLPNVCVTAMASAEEALEALARQGGAMAANLALWRSSRIGESAVRRDLRAVCPGTAWEEAGTDMAMDTARALLREPALYERALGLSHPLAAAAP